MSFEFLGDEEWLARRDAARRAAKAEAATVHAYSRGLRAGYAQSERATAQRNDAEVAEMVAADVRAEIDAARGRLIARANSYEGSANALAANGFGADASCLRTVASELRAVAGELL